MWSSPHCRDASSHQIRWKHLYPIQSYWHFSKMEDGGRRHLGFSSKVNLAHYDMLIVWRLSSVPNLVQISVIITEIDTLLSKERKKKAKRVANWPFTHTTHVAGWPPVCSSIYQVLLKFVYWFCRCEWSKIALSYYFGHWLIQQLVLPRKPWQAVM